MPLDLRINTELQGFFRVEVLRAGKVRSDTGWFPNLITNQGMDRLGATSAAPVYGYCHVGSGNATPAESDVALQSFIAGRGSRSATSFGVDGEGGYAWRRNEWTFLEGAAAGNIAEVATAWTLTGNTIFSRALVKDSEGNPTTVTVLSDEFLRVSWEHRRYWPTADVSGSVANSGNIGGSFNWTTRTAQNAFWSVPESQGALELIGGVSNYYGTVALGDISSEPSGTKAGTAGVTQLAYIAGSYKRKVTLNYGLTQGINAAGPLGGLAFQFNGARFQAVIEPGILKLDSQLLDITLSCTWARRA